MNDYAKIKYRYFFLSLTLSFFVLSLTFLLLMNAVHPKAPEAPVPAPEDMDEVSAYTPTAQDALSVLFIGESDEPARDTFILARFDPARGKVPIAAIPPRTAVQNAGKTEPISEVYRYGGADYARDVLEETLGVPIDRYARLKQGAFISCAAVVGTVEYDLTEPLTVDRNGSVLRLGAGRQLLDGQKAADVIMYSGYPGGEITRCAVAAELTAAIVNQRMDICRSAVIDNVFEKLVNLIDTDISYTDYYERKRAAEFLSRLGEDPGEPVALSGEFSGDGALYTLSDTFLALLSQRFR